MVINFNGISTTNLGFGCSLLTRNNSLRDAILNLESVYDSGVRHFDCAKLYGFGQAEIILGKFARDKRHEITITSKTGLKAREMPLWTLPMVNFVRGIAKSNPKVNNVGLLNLSPILGVFSPNSIQNDLNISLKKIGTDYLDFYLLHEASISQANREDLIAVLQKNKTEGKIRKYGIASNSLSIKNEYLSLNGSYEILQHSERLFEQNIASMPLNDEKVMRIVYNIFSRLSLLKNELTNKQDFNDPIKLLLSYYQKVNAKGITLFSATNNNNIFNTVKTWNDLSFGEFEPLGYNSDQLFEQLFSNKKI